MNTPSSPPAESAWADAPRRVLLLDSAQLEGGGGGGAASFAEDDALLSPRRPRARLPSFSSPRHLRGSSVHTLAAASPLSPAAGARSLEEQAFSTLLLVSPFASPMPSPERRAGPLAAPLAAREQRPRGLSVGSRCALSVRARSCAD